MPIPNEIIEKIKGSVNIVDVISEYVDLKPSGKNYKGLCPFHNEKTPSFVVNQEKGIFHCFGCGVGGNVFTFLMKMKGIAFVEAVKLLARKAGVNIYEYREWSKGASGKLDLYKINKVAARFYKKLLFSNEGKRALSYLKSRNISNESIENFNIGFAANRWDSLIKYMKNHGIKETELEKVGLVVKKRNNSGYYDRFRNRIMFPIQDTIGRIIGFGGRKLENNSDIPKYLNTSDNQLFHKGKSLYGFFNAEQFIRKEGCVFIVEGYLDVISMYQSGIKNIIAPLGTALTKDHIEFITRYTKKIYLSFDPDDAGQKAAIRGIKLFHAAGIDPLVVRFPTNIDPAEFFNKYSVDDFKLLINESLTGVQFLVKRYTKNKNNFTAQEKLSVIEELSEFYINIKDRIIRDEMIEEIANSLSIEKLIVKDELNKFIKNERKKVVNSYRDKKVTSPVSRIKKELYLILLLLNNKDYFDIAYNRLDSSHFKGKWTKKLWSIMSELYEKNDLDVSTVFNHVQDEKFISFISGKLMDESLYINPREQLIDLISYLKEKLLKEKLENLNKMIKEAELENREKEVENLLTEKQMYRNELKKVELLRSSKSLI